MTTKVTYIAVEEHSKHVIFLVSSHPRAELLRVLKATYAEKMYVDDANGIAYHIGYIINQQWYTLYQVSGRGPK